MAERASYLYSTPHCIQICLSNKLQPSETFSRRSEEAAFHYSGKLERGGHIFAEGGTARGVRAMETRAIGRQKTQSFPVSVCISGRAILTASDSPSHDTLLFQVHQCAAENSPTHDRPVKQSR